MNNEVNKHLGPFMSTFGICGMIAGGGLIFCGNWQGIFGLLSGVLVAFLAFHQIKESKNMNQ